MQLSTTLMIKFRYRDIKNLDVTGQKKHLLKLELKRVRLHHLIHVITTVHLSLRKNLRR